MKVSSKGAIITVARNVIIKGAFDIARLVSAILIFKILINKPSIDEQSSMLNVMVIINLKVDKFFKKLSILVKSFINTPLNSVIVLIITTIDIIKLVY